MDINEYKRLKSRAENARKDADVARGNLEAAMHRLKEEFDCDTSEDAKELLDRLKSERMELEKEYDVKMEEFEREFGDKI